MSEDKEKRHQLIKDIVSALVTDRPELEQFTDQRSLELVHLPKLEELYQTVYYPVFRDTPSPEDFRRELLKDFDKWDEEIKAAYQAYKEATTAPGRPISLSPNTEDKDDAPRRRYLYTLFTNTLKTRFLQLSFPIMLEAEAARLIMEAEEKAARIFEEWKNQSRYILAEADPAILTEKRRAAIEAHQKSFTPILHAEVTTRLTLLYRVKRILKDIKAGRDNRRAAHYTYRLARRMANARIIQYLGQRIQSALPENKQAFKWLQREYPAIFEAYETGRYSDITIYTFEDWRAGKTNYIHPTAQPVTDAKNPEKRYLDILPPNEAERIKTYRIETAERLINGFLEPRKAAFTALLHKPAQETERKAAFTALTDPKALLIQAPAGDIAPQHTTPEHKPPGNYITQAYKQLTPDNYFREIHAEALSPITSYPFLMAEALRRYLDWIDSQEGSQAEKKEKPQAEPLPTFEDLTEPMTEALKDLDLLSDIGGFIGDKKQARFLFYAWVGIGKLSSRNTITELYSAYFKDTFGFYISGRTLRETPTGDTERKEVAIFKAALSKKIGS